MHFLFRGAYSFLSRKATTLKKDEPELVRSAIQFFFLIKKNQKERGRRNEKLVDNYTRRS